MPFSPQRRKDVRLDEFKIRGHSCIDHNDLQRPHLRRSSLRGLESNNRPRDRCHSSYLWIEPVNTRDVHHSFCDVQYLAWVALMLGYSVVDCDCQQRSRLKRLAYVALKDLPHLLWQASESLTGACQWSCRACIRLTWGLAPKTNPTGEELQ